MLIFSPKASYLFYDQSLILIKRSPRAFPICLKTNKGYLFSKAFFFFGSPLEDNSVL